MQVPRRGAASSPWDGAGVDSGGDGPTTHADESTYRSARGVHRKKRIPHAGSPSNTPPEGCVCVCVLEPSRLAVCEYDRACPRASPGIAARAHECVRVGSTGIAPTGRGGALAPMAPPLRLCVAALFAAGASGARWDVRSDVASLAYLADIGDGTQSFIWEPFRVLPVERIGVLGKENCVNPPQRACGTVEMNVGVVAHRVGLHVGAVVYTREVESELMGAVDDILGEGDAEFKTTCQLFNPDVANHSAVVAAIADGRLIMESQHVSRSGSPTVLRGVHALPHADLWIASVVACTEDYVPTYIGQVIEDSNGEAVPCYMDFYNPTGHLGYMAYQLMMFHEYNSFFLTIALMVWGVYGLLNRAYWSPMHSIMTLGLTVLIAEHLTMYYTYRTENNTGDAMSGVQGVALVVAALRKVAVMFLLAVLVHGYRTVYVTLKEINIKCIAIFTGIYALVCLVSAIEDLVGDNSSERLKQQSIIETVQSAADLAVYLWIIESLGSLIRKLNDQKQTVKERLYRQLYKLLIGFILAQVVFMVVVILLMFRDRSQSERHWRSWWILHAFFFIAFEVVILAMMVLWRPTEASAMLLYSVELGDDENNVVEMSPQRCQAPGPSAPPQADTEAGMFDDVDMEGINEPAEVMHDASAEHPAGAGRGHDAA